MRIFKGRIFKNSVYYVYDTYYMAYKDKRFWYRGVNVETIVSDKAKVYEITFDNYIKTI